jgi:adenylate cyclase
LFAKNKKKSILILIVITFWVVYVGLVSTQYSYAIFNNITKMKQIHKQKMDYVLELSAGLIIRDNLDYLKDRLKQAREVGMFDFYILQKKDAVVAFYNRQNNADDINANYRDFDKFIETKDFVFKTIKIYDYRLTVGMILNSNKLFLRGISERIYLYLLDITAVTLLLGFILFLTLKDIINLSKLVASKDRGRAGQLKSMSKEGQALLSAATTYETEQKSLRAQKDFLSGSLTPAILFEIKNKTQVPSTFESTMVRIDLNGYTQLYLEKKEAYVTEILNKYFVAARELIERYNGLVYQYVGDEIVFHFKGPRDLAEPLAVACVRSLFELGEEVERTLPPEAGHYFKLKASMASGNILFVKLDTGFGLSGLPLIESARLLSQIDDKTKNSLAVYESSQPYISNLCTLSEPKVGYMKGFSEAAQICIVTEFVRQEEVFAHGKIENCTFFRSDVDLMLLLQHLGKLVAEQNDKAFFKIFADLKHLKANIICPPLEKAFTEFLEKTYRQSHDKSVDPRILSAAVSVATNLIPQGSGSDKLTEILKLYLEFADPRVQANALTVLGEAPSNVHFLRKFINSDHNRLSADALVVAGKQVVDNDLVKRVQKLLRSSDKVYQASGRYVAMKLVEHYKEHDAVYYNTNPHLKKLEELLGKAA